MSRSSRKIINLALVGASGRMGHEIEKLASSSSVFKVVVRLDEDSSWPVDRKSVDVVLDFSSPQGLGLALTWCLKHKVALVSGTTGLTKAEKERLRRAARKIPILYSANMSPGVALFVQILQNFKAIKDWSFEIEESHHQHKKDKPSGTALLLQQILDKTIGRKSGPIVSHRLGEVPGTHQIKAIGPEETLTVQHVAHDRRVFARGALSAARWLFDKKRPGLYDLSDLHKLS